jgi:hypothetical protein
MSSIIQPKEMSSGDSYFFPNDPPGGSNFHYHGDNENTTQSYPKEKQKKGEIAA